MILLSQRIFEVKILFKSAVYNYNVKLFRWKKKPSTSLYQITSTLNSFGDKLL